MADRLPSMDACACVSYTIKKTYKQNTISEIVRNSWWELNNYFCVGVLGSPLIEEGYI